MGITLKSGFKLAAGVTALAATTAFAGQITLYERPGFQGRSIATADTFSNLERSPFDNVASSVVVSDGIWEACTRTDFRGTCAQLVPGNYANLYNQLNGRIASVRQVGTLPSAATVSIAPDPAPLTINPPVIVNPAPAIVNSEPRRVAVNPIPPAGPRVILYQHTPSGIRAVELGSNIDDLGYRNFSGYADSAWVSNGVWRLCDGVRGTGQCADYSPGQYASLGTLDGRVVSAYLVSPSVSPSDTVSAIAPGGTGRMVLYQYENFGGPSAVVDNNRTPDLNWAEFKYPASSVRIESGTWMVCTDMAYRGDCRVLGVGDYPALQGMRGIVSARQVWPDNYSAFNGYRATN